MMIWLASHYCESTIDLFDKEEPHHLMAEGHLRQRDLALCSIVDSLREAIGTANQQHQSLVDRVHLVLEEGAELARSELLAFLVEQNEHVARLQAVEHHVGLLFLLLFFGQALGILKVGHFLDSKRHIVSQSLLIVGYRLLKELSHGLANEHYMYAHEM